MKSSFAALAVLITLFKAGECSTLFKYFLFFLIGLNFRWSFTNTNGNPSYGYNFLYLYF